MKKITVEEWNKDIFRKISGKDFNKIVKIIPHFVTWTSNPDEEDSSSEWQEIERLDLEFEDGSKVSIIPKTNKDDVSLDDEENPICLALDIIQFRPESINWRRK
jgi:hypothetical protein